MARRQWFAVAVLVGWVALAPRVTAVAAEDHEPSVSGVHVDPDGGVSGAASGDVRIDLGHGGIAGTGLGKMPPAGEAAGTGNSVPGPAGQDMHKEPARSK